MTSTVYETTGQPAVLPSFPFCRTRESNELSEPLWHMQKISFFYPVHTPKLHRTYFWFHGEGLVPFMQLWRFTEVLWHQNHRKGATGLEQNYSTSILLNLRTKFQSLQRATDAALWLLGIYERWSSPDTKL